MAEAIDIRPATAEEAANLSDLALRSKGHWGYTEEFLESCRAELTVDPERTGADGYWCYVAEAGSDVAGFYSVSALADRSYELEALFVDPQFIGKGIGRALMQHAVALLSAQRASRLIIQGDPHATDFYLAAGARQTGQRESGSIPGRYLPLFEIRIQ